jgi:branched-chain amino acid transport system ATP-binding protein
MSELLGFSGVDSGYGDARILHKVDMSIGEGERVAILGRNGVGKTTVVNTFLGVADLTGGEVRMAGQRQSAIRNFTAARLGIAVVPQGRRIVPTLTVQENLTLGAATGRTQPWTMERVFDLFPVLRERANTLGTTLSGGQQQMLAIGRALMSNPSLLVLDEPSEGLAPVIIDEFAAVLQRLAGTGTALLLIEQHFGLVHSVAERYYVLAKGTIVENGYLAGISMESLKKHVAV